MQWRWQANQSSMATSSILSCWTGPQTKYKVTGWWFKMYLFSITTTFPQSHNPASERKPSGPQWHPLPPAVTVIVSFHWAMLPLPAQVTSSAPLPRVQLRTIPGQGEQEMPFSFTLSGYIFFFCIFLCVPNVTSYNSEGLLCKVLIADWPNSAFPDAFP